MKITKVPDPVNSFIKEELQVVLTNEEVEEMFGEEVRAQVEAHGRRVGRKKIDLEGEEKGKGKSS